MLSLAPELLYANGSRRVYGCRRVEKMSSDPGSMSVLAWRDDLPVLRGHVVVLREPLPQDRSALLAIVSQPEASRFGIDGPITAGHVLRLIDSARRDRGAGLGFTYVISSPDTRGTAGIIQVRRLDPTFEGAE